jgi:glycerophosphoryl diester phosphodiesterase
MGRTQFLAHRGASGLAPENTLASFDMCLQWDPDYIELDVQRSRDGHLVVFHDPTLKRTSNGTGYLKDYTLAELKALDAGSWFDARFAGERIPTLDEVLKRYKGRVKLAIEIKYGSLMYPGIEKEMLDAVLAADLLDDVVFSSFNWESMIQIKRMEPRAKTQIICLGHSKEFVSTAARYGCSVVAIEHHYISPDIVADAKAQGIELIAWVVDDPAEQKRWIDIGVSQVTTNRPDRFAAVLRGDSTQG